MVWEAVFASLRVGSSVSLFGFSLGSALKRFYLAFRFGSRATGFTDDVGDSTLFKMAP